ncbi:MAG: hypothetical protein EP329_14035 [Deltaproteobacteria bacterium]|nr:MAG: hypothetical protein EP329_14035 [Deltaproteobacteria bacterium]
MTETRYDDRLVAALRVVRLETRRSADNVRKGLIAAIRQAFHADFVAYLGYTEADDGEILCTGVHGVGLRSATEIVVEGEPVPFGAEAIRRPLTSTLNRFVQRDLRTGSAPAFVGTFYAGDEALGSLVVCVGDRRVRRQVVQGLNEAAPQFAAMLRRAADLDDEVWLAGSPVAAIASVDGTLGEVTNPAMAHLAGRRGARLCERIGEAIVNGGPRRFPFSGAWVRVAPLLGAGSESAYLVTLSQADRPSLAADHALSPRQRRVLALYLDGLRPSAIAAQLELTARTVQRTLKQCFERLGSNDVRTLRVLLDDAQAPVKRLRERPSVLSGRAVALDHVRRGLLEAPNDRV